MFVLRGVGFTERIENIHFEHHVFGSWDVGELLLML